jgi:UDP-N-acetylmuramate dehydrogenase
VLKLGRRFSGFSFSGARVRAKGGVWVPRLVRNIADAGLSGMEHASGIPGSLGGLVTMNGGSLRRSVGENILSVDAVSHAGEMRTFSREECDFSYRHSFFQCSGTRDEERWIILGALLELTPGDRGAIRREQLRILEERRVKFPHHQPNCGSVFSNVPAVYDLAGPPGRIVEETGLKGKQVGGAQVSFCHANFIVNMGGATARDVLSLIGEVRRRVYDRIGVWLDCEVRYADERGVLVPASEACL